MQVLNIRNARDLGTLDKQNPKIRILKKFLDKVLISVSTMGGGKSPKVIRDIILSVGKYEFPKGDRTTTIYVSRSTY
jgi:hypothetical protein